MPEHTPAPTPSRAVYGFALFLAMKSCFFIYVIWSVIPDNLLLLLNLDCLPQKYWAIAVPVQVLGATFVFAFFIYPGMNLCLAPTFDDVSSVTDKHAVFRCSCEKYNNFKCQEVIKDDSWITKSICSKHLHGAQNISTEIKQYKKKKRICDCKDKSRCMVAREPSYKKPVEPVSDISLSEVNRILYS